MSNKSVVVEIFTDGSSKIEAMNFKGVGCKDATRALEIALAGENPDGVDRKPKPDFYASIGGTNGITTR